MLKLNVDLFRILKLSNLPKKLTHMNKHLLSFLLFFFGCAAIHTQVINGKIISNTSNKPIYRAAIVTNLKTGTESDKQGEFELQIKNVKTITFSCLGYNSKTITIENLKKQQYIITLVENINQLDEIQLNLSKINLDSLLVKTQRSMKNNYITEPALNHFYAREYSEIDFKKLELALEKSTLLNKKSKKLAEKELEAYARNLSESNPKVTLEYNGVLKSQKQYSEKLKREFNISKIDTIEGITFMNNDKNITIETAQKDLQNIVLKHLDTNKTYKISSGLFRIEDSLSIKDIIKETDSLATDNSFDVNTTKYYYSDAIRNATFFKNNTQKNFLSRKFYEHYLEKNEYLGSKLFYVVRFYPKKSKAKFSGKFYIDPKDYSLAKISYSFAEGKKGMNVNLKWILGIKASENMNTATIYYEKNEQNKLYVAYFKETLGNYAYVHRPIKFKENSKEKQKAKFDIKIEVNVLSTREVLLSNVTSIDKFKVKPRKKNDPIKKVPYLSKTDYQNKDWKNRQFVNDYLKKWN